MAGAITVVFTNPFWYARDGLISADPISTD
jgi:hypothetical protein